MNTSAQQSSCGYRRPSAVPNYEIVVLKVFNASQQLFFDPTHSESWKPWRIFFAFHSLSCFPAPMFAQNMQAQNYSLHVAARTTLAWRNIAAHMWNVFFSCLPLMILPPGIGDFCIFLCFPRAISSIHLGNNVVSVTLSVLQSLSRQHLRLQTSQRSPRYTCACHWFVQLKYPHSAILPFRNWGCVHYAGKYGNFVHRGTMLASFWGFLKGQFKYSNN